MQYLKTFIAGSSFPVVLIPSLYLGISMSMQPDAGFSFFNEAIFIPVFFGTINILFIMIKKHIPGSNIQKYFIWGAVHGLFFSLLGNFWLDIPEKLFLLSGWIKYLTIPAAMILYACIWRYIVWPINRLLEVDA